jgi:hypothetical protein
MHGGYGGCGAYNCDTIPLKQLVFDSLLLLLLLLLLSSTIDVHALRYRYNLRTGWYLSIQFGDYRTIVPILHRIEQDGPNWYIPSQ